MCNCRWLYLEGRRGVLTNLVLFYIDIEFNKCHEESYRIRLNNIVGQKVNMRVAAIPSVELNYLGTSVLLDWRHFFSVWVTGRGHCGETADIEVEMCRF